MKKIMKFSPGKMLSTGFVILAALAAATPQTQGSSCTPPPAGLVGWWSGESNAHDIVGGNNGSPVGNLGYTNGVAGQAFVFDESTSYISVPASPSLDIGTGSGITIECWIKPDAGVNAPIIEWDSATASGLQLWVANGNTQLFSNIEDTSGNPHTISFPYVFNTNNFQHVAVTYDKGSGLAILYLNSTNVASANFGSITPQTTYPANIGRRTGEPIGLNDTYGGLIDELSLYNRALSQAEIQSIANAGGAGKCAPTATACVTPPSGLVAWWPAEGNANDIVGTNNGILQAGASYAVGKVGRAFFLNNANAYVRVPASASLKNIATANGLTIEGWIDVTNVAGLHPIAEFSDGVGNYGVQLWVGSNPSDNGLLYAALVDTNGNYHQLYSPQYTIITNTFQHIALTYDKASGAGTLYVNGVIVAQSTWASFSPQTDYDLWLGHRSQNCGGGCWTDGTHLGGLLDELSLYNRALSQTEIQSIYNAGSAGKCAPQTGMLSQQLINLDFGAGGGRGYSLKTGFAAIGQATNDFWNFYDRDVSPSPYDWRTSGALVNLQLANGALTTVGVSVSDAPGAWNDESSDSMYKTYDYPLDGGNNVVTFTNLAAGQYNVLAYSPDGNFEVTVGGISYGVKTTYDSPASSVPVWTEGVQYACFRNVTVTAGQSLVLTVRNGVSAPALLSGVQIVSSGIMSNLPPTILSQTPSQVVLLGNTATFSVTASGSHPLSYFWKRNGAIISGATNFSYTLYNAQLSDSGSKFSCLVTNAYGLAASTNATLKVIDTIANDLCSGAIIITNASYTNVQSTVRASSFGDPVPDCVTGFGNGVWYQFTAPVNGLLIVDTFGSDFDTGLAIYTGSCDALTEAACNDDTGGVNSQVTMPATGGTTYSILAGGYSAHAGNLVLHLNHLTPPAFAVQPTNQSVVVGSNASFATTVSGAQPISFQWYFNNTLLVDGGRISGSTNATLNLANIVTNDAGNYQVVASNFLGVTTSSVAVLTVLVPPTITMQPIGRSVPPGLPTTFNATASGNPTPNYQWQLNGTNIPGATSSSYLITAVNTNNLGFYHLVASNSIGVAVSADAQLTFGPVAAWGRNLNNECLPPPGLSNVVGVAVNSGVSYAVRTDGTIVAWGGGTGTNIPASASNVVAFATYGSLMANYALRSDGKVVSWAGIGAPALSNIVSVAAGFSFSYALRAEGTLTNWTTGAGSGPVFPAGLNHIAAIACGYNNALALRNDGTVVVAGGGTISNIPSGLNNVVAVAVGYSYAMALKASGTVVAWGSGTGTNLPTGLTNIVAISAGNYSGENVGLAIRDNGRVVAWGDGSIFGASSPPAALTNLFSIAGAAGAYHGLALVNDGSPVILHPPIGLTAYTGRDVTLQASAAGAQPLSYQWLLNGTNIPGATSTSLVLSNVQFSNAGGYQLSVTNALGSALSLSAPLTVISNNALVFLSQPAAQTNYQGGKVQLGTTVLGSGPLKYQWYYSPSLYSQIYTPVSGATNDILTLEPALASQTGYYYVVVSNNVAHITSSPTFLRVLFAKAWGYLATDPPFDVTNATAIAVGNVGQGLSSGHYLVLKSDGKIASWSGGFVNYGETNVAALSNSVVTAIAAGYGDSLALKSDGTVYAIGYNNYGETNVPAGLSGVTAIACGDYHDLALKADGTVVGWGQNTYLQTTNAAATNVVAIAAGGQNSMALRADGSVTTWGLYGTQVPSNVTNIVAIACGAQHFLALRANGTVVGWGSNPYGQTTIPASWSNIVAISASANHSVALRNDGTVVTLGAYIGSTLITAPSDLANVIAIASSGDHDLGLFGTRAPAFTVQPWNRSIPFNTTTNIRLTGKCSGVQPVSYQWQLNGTNIPGATSDSLILTNRTNPYPPNPYPPPYPPEAVLIPTGAYQLIASNAYGVAASKYAKVTTFIPLGTALNTPLDAKTGYLYNWTTSGNAQWFGETNVSHDGVSAAQSGGIGPLQQTILQTTVATNWSGRYTFWWKVSSEQDFDILEFRINGIVQTSISGLLDWQQVSIPVVTGTNVLMWRYSKDASFDVGQDAGWVDQFAFIPDGPTITLQPVSQTVNMGTNVTFFVTATGPPFSQNIFRYQWRQNGNLVGGNNPLLILNNVGRAQNGTYSVTISNIILSGSSTVSSNAVLKVLVPQLLGSPKLLPNGSFQLTSTDANGGLLSPSDLANFEAQASTNLVNWVTLPNALSLTNGLLQFQDSGQSNFTARYYRLIEH